MFYGLLKSSLLTDHISEVYTEDVELYINYIHIIMCKKKNTEIICIIVISRLLDGVYFSQK